MNLEMIKILVVFGLAVFFLGRRVSINIVMPAAAVLLALFFLIPPLDFLRGYGLSLISLPTIELVLTMFAIMLLEELMRKRGYLERMLSSLDGLFHSKRLDISLMPMIIGFLPSAGGALFSAPMVEQAAEGTDLTPETKTYLNTLYRHTIEIFFPTYPGIILACEIANLPVARLMPVLFPLAVVVFLIGQLPLRKLPRYRGEKSAGRAKLALALLLALWPLLALIFVIVLFQAKVYLTAGAILLLLLLVERFPLRELPRFLKESTNLRLLLMVMVVMAFKDTMVLCGVMEIIPAAVAGLPIPGFLVFAIVALLIGMMTGMTVAAVGITLPLALAAGGDPLPMTALIMASSYCGCQITPMHLCITLVAEKFQANLRQVLLKSLPTYMTIWGLAIGIFLLIR